MAVAVMDIGKMGMTVNQWFMPMRMGMRFFAVPCEVVIMPVMHIVLVRMRMQRGFMAMVVRMRFS